MKSVTTNGDECSRVGLEISTNSKRETTADNLETVGQGFS